MPFEVLEKPAADQPTVGALGAEACRQPEAASLQGVHTHPVPEVGQVCAAAWAQNAAHRLPHNVVPAPHAEYVHLSAAAGASLDFSGSDSWPACVAEESDACQLPSVRLSLLRACAVRAARIASVSRKEYRRCRQEAGSQLGTHFDILATASKTRNVQNYRQTAAGMEHSQQALSLVASSAPLPRKPRPTCLQLTAIRTTTAQPRRASSYKLCRLRSHASGVGFFIRPICRALRGSLGQTVAK